MSFSRFPSEKNAERLEQFWRKQMRAYLTVNIGLGRHQDRRKGIKFEVMPVLLNSGHTPAHNMNYWANASIEKFPLPDDFNFPKPTDIHERGFVLGPSQSITLNAIVDDFVDDKEVADIKAGNTRRVHIWGEVTYEDVFGDSHKTRFCHSLFWFGEGENEIVSGTYAEKYNEAT